VGSPVKSPSNERILMTMGEEKWGTTHQPREQYIPYVPPFHGNLRDELRGAIVVPCSLAKGGTEGQLVSVLPYFDFGNLVYVGIPLERVGKEVLGRGSRIHRIKEKGGSDGFWFPTATSALSRKISKQFS